MQSQGPIVLSTEVEQALHTGAPLVALESSVIAQGLPRPTNFAAALQMEAAVREGGAIPATLAVVDGSVYVGLDRDQIERLAFSDGIEKAGLRDLGWALATGATMATTVGSSLGIAHRVGIRVMATGGIGGVHRGAPETGDISNDLHVLATAPCVTVCSGMKSILDLSRSMEYLETLGVPVVGYKTQTLPNFYGLDSGIAVPGVNDPPAVVRMLLAQEELRLPNGIVVVNPPPEEYAFSADELDRLVADAEQAAADQGVSGKAVTPFMLAHIAAATDGRSVTLNVALLRSNATLAAEIAEALVPTPA
jgi:pseudouridine-5'-phosphate glycosidase